MDAGALAILSLGFISGLRHALDADHVVAVSTIVSEHKSVLRSCIVGTFWGLGHTLSLVVMGLAIMLMRVSLDERMEAWLELPVAIMLLALGLHTIRRTAIDSGWRVHTHAHRHDDEPPHSHLHVHANEEHSHSHHALKVGRRPFIVGLVHGVAGSAGLMLVVVATINSVALGLLYMGVFGVGSIGGMLVMSALIGMPFAVTARRHAGINATIRLLAGLLSILLGVIVGVEVLQKLAG